MENKREERIRNVMSAVFGIPLDKIDSESSPDTIDSWDSLKHLNLVIALEEEFETRFSDEQTVQMLNYKLIVEVVKETLDNSNKMPC